MDHIKAILFDSGRVLNYPQMGHWFISPRFFEYVDEVTFKNLEREKLYKAFANASEYINSIRLIKNKDEELEHFKQFYLIMADCLPELSLSLNDIHLMANDLVNNSLKYTFYDDAKKILPQISKKYKLAIVSDAWPSLKDVYEKVGLHQYFSSVVISSILGVTKPHRLMYETALEELNIKFNEAIFIDDNYKNCVGAQEVGIKPYLLCRNKEKYQQLLSTNLEGCGVINSLTELTDTVLMEEKNGYKIPSTCNNRDRKCK